MGDVEFKSSRNARIIIRIMTKNNFIIKMTDKQLKEWVDRYLRNDIKTIRYDTRFKKNLGVFCENCVCFFQKMCVFQKN